MKAWVATAYGGPDVLQLREVPTPVPAADEVLIRVHATTVTSGDWRVRSLDLPAGFGPFARLMFGAVRPRQPILGTELAGVVAAVGGAVTRFRVGDEVFAFSDARMGCHAEYKVMPEGGAVAPRPAGLTFEEAAALAFGGTTALHFFRRAGLRRGERVLVNGASGAVGTAAVQLARHSGAHVTGVCSTANLELVRALGADRAVDYTREDALGEGAAYDVIMDTAGTMPFSRCEGALAEGGRLLVVLGSLPEMLRIPWVSVTTDKQVFAGPASGGAEAVQHLAGLAEAGHFTPVIDRCYPFEAMPEAHRYVDTGRKRGNVVVTLEPEGGA